MKPTRLTASAAAEGQISRAAVGGAAYKPCEGRRQPDRTDYCTRGEPKKPSRVGPMVMREKELLILHPTSVFAAEATGTTLRGFVDKARNKTSP